MMLLFANSIKSIYVGYPHQFESEFVSIMTQEDTIQKYRYSTLQCNPTDEEEFYSKMQ